MSQPSPLIDPHQRKRLIIHAGTSKTGSTSIQSYLDQHRVALKRKGILYPSVGVLDGWMPKHQWLVNDILDQDYDDFNIRMQAVQEECDTLTRIIILSTEGIANHWWDFTNEGLEILRGLRDEFDVSCWLWFREPASFFKSYYIQILKNGRHPRFDAYGQDRSPSEMLDMPWVARHLDYNELINGLGEVLGEKNIFSFSYTKDTVVDVLKLLSVDWEPESSVRINKTAVTPSQVASLRIKNSHKANDGQNIVPFSDAELLESLSNGSEEFDLNADDLAKIRLINESSIESLDVMSELSLARWWEGPGRYIDTPVDT